MTVSIVKIDFNRLPTEMRREVFEKFDKMDIATLKKCMLVNHEFYQHAGRALLKHIVKFVQTQFSLLTEPTVEQAKNFYSKVIKNEVQLLSSIQSFLSKSQVGVKNVMEIQNVSKTQRVFVEFTYGPSKGKERVDYSSVVLDGAIVKNSSCLSSSWGERIKRNFRPDVQYSIQTSNLNLESEVLKIVRKQIETMDKAR